MSFLKKLFGGGGAGGGSAPQAEPEVYKDFRIFPEPIRESGGHRIAARIEKEIGGETMVHKLVRADVISDHDQAIEASLAKARQIIDEQGDRLF